MSKPLIELFVKASVIDRNDVGSCPISQKWLMAFYLLVEEDRINLKVTPVNPDCPVKQFTELKIGKRLPAAKVLSNPDSVCSKAVLLSENLEFNGDDLEEFLKLWHCSSFDQNYDQIRKAELVFEDLFKKFNLYLHSNNFSNFLNELSKLNNYFGRSCVKFLTGESVSLPDCDLMPKMQHIRVVCSYFREVDLPDDLCHLWTYIRHMYSVEAFKISCPKDRDILLHYKDKLCLNNDQLRSINQMANDTSTKVPNVASSRCAKF